MPASRTFPRRTLAALLLAAATLGTARLAAQTHPTPPPAPVHVQPISDHDLKATQDELIKLLRESPTLTTVVEHDPSLLANQEYVRRNNPQLAQFLETHPEIALNPDYYLFTHLNTEGGSDQALERAVWPELQRPSYHDSTLARLAENLIPFLVFLCICGAILWLVRIFLENRRWNRIFKLQMDVHGRLIEKFNSSQELLTYMDTESGKRFLEAAPLAVNFDADQGIGSRIPATVARILTPLQIGAVLTLLGLGLLFIRHSHPDLEIPLLLLGTFVLMPGIGFILSAGFTWVLAARLGLMPKQTLHSAYDNTLTPRERQ